MKPSWWPTCFSFVGRGYRICLLLGVRFVLDNICFVYRLPTLHGACMWIIVHFFCTVACESWCCLHRRKDFRFWCVSHMLVFPLDLANCCQHFRSYIRYTVIVDPLVTCTLTPQGLNSFLFTLCSMKLLHSHCFHFTWLQPDTTSFLHSFTCLCKFTHTALCS